MVPRAGLEPARSCLRGILNPLCLPIPPPGQLVCSINTLITLDILKKLNLRSQDLPNTYEVNGLAYLISPEDLMKQKTFFSKSIVPLVTLDKKEAVDIDYLEDFKEAESLLSKD